ncbi:MAG: hypothetical protein KF729_23975 [Sandaracinaceae bacterium]|nr:hypothetical protein [Sandaracinaceae bacterium]
MNRRRELLTRLEDGPPDNALLEELETLFEQDGDLASATWLRLERLGYGHETGLHNLGDVLDEHVPPAIVQAIVRSRVRRGRLQIGDDGPVVEWPHFFVEPFDELRRLRNAIAHGGPITVDFLVAEGSGEPRSLVFPSGVFIDIVARVTLEIADVLRRGDP